MKNKTLGEKSKTLVKKKTKQNKTKQQQQLSPQKSTPFSHKYSFTAMKVYLSLTIGRYWTFWLFSQENNKDMLFFN